LLDVIEPVICEPLRTPVGRFGGSLSRCTASDLAEAVVAEILVRTGLEDPHVDDLILGHAYPNAEAPAIGRVVALNTGLQNVPGVQVDRRCGSGIQAVMFAAGQIASGAADLVIAGGTESMSQVEHYAMGLRTPIKQGAVPLLDRLDRARETAGGRHHPIPGGMIETAENLRRTYAITREAQDELALRSHQRAVAARGGLTRNWCPFLFLTEPASSNTTNTLGQS
jgi:acetyl-CoA C-acetyltransferase